MDEGEKTLVHGLPDHFTPWHQFGIKFMENVLQVVTFNRLFRIEQFKELLNKLRGHIDL